MSAVVGLGGVNSWPHHQFLECKALFSNMYQHDEAATPVTTSPNNTAGRLPLPRQSGCKKLHTFKRKYKTPASSV